MISLCMIARNEEANIARALTPIIDAVDEVILIDDESEDMTSAVALSFGLKVSAFKSGVTERPAYPDILKNRAINKASGDIIIILDCDEIYEPDLIKMIPEMAKALEDDVCDSFGFIRKTYVDGVYQNPYDLDWQVRMFKKGSAYSGEELHQGIIGYQNCKFMNLIIYHFKTAKMQIEDNELYVSLGYEL